jgi:hypothetical protein
LGERDRWRSRHNSPVRRNHLADGNGSCGSGGLSGRRNGEGSLGQFEEKWGKEVNKGGFFRGSMHRNVLAQLLAPFFLSLMCS